jgi:PmbA protein
MHEAATQPDLPALDLESLAADVVALAMKAGATDAEAVAREGDEFSVNVRMGEVETLKESGSRGLGLRVFLGKQSASASTSDLTPDGIRQLVEGALALANVTEEDPFAGLPDTAEFGSLAGDLHLYYDDVYSLEGKQRIEWARRAEAAALAADPRITNSDGGSFDAATGSMALANSRGFHGGYRTSYAGVSAAPLAMDVNGQMQRDGWWSSARRLADLESPESIGQEAARRTLRRLGARRVPTQRVPIVFAPEVARSLVGSLFEAASGDSIWRGASFLAGKLGEPIAASTFTIPSPSSTTTPCCCPRARAATAPRLSMAKACPPGELWSSRPASCAATCSTPTPRASWASSPHTTPPAASPARPASASAICTSSRGT